MHENAAMNYLLSLNSPLSREKMGYFLKVSARILNNNNDILLCPWHKLKSTHVRAIMSHLANAGKAPNTIHGYVSALKGVARFAWILEQMSMTTYSHIKDVKLQKGYRIPKGRALTKKETKDLFAACAADISSIGVRDQAIIAILVGCGLRRSELVKINIDDICFTEQSILVLGKGNKERLSYMSDSVWSKVNYWITKVRGTHSGYLFCRIRKNNDIQDSNLTSQAIYEILLKRGVEAKIAKFSPHDLRRTYASNLLNSNVNLMVIRDMLGHTSIKTTQKYIKTQDEKMKKASELIQV